MGNFSRDPESRLIDAELKRYVGLRIQQGVPVLDADLHLLDGLHRLELETIGKWVLGDGVPVGSDGFRILAFPGGGVGTLVLVAKSVLPGPSSLEVVLASSSAAAALGFGSANAKATRRGSSPARITGLSAQPFHLSAGNTLTVRVDGGAPQTATFQPADFADITKATAAEVAAKVSSSVPGVTAQAGAGNDFIIRGSLGGGLVAGRLIVEGRMIVNELDVPYTGQPLYDNAALATEWGVTKVAPLAALALNQSFIVFVDVWHREVGRPEDPAVVDTRIGVETAVMLRREWAVRLALLGDFQTLPRPSGHSYYPLARINRKANEPAIAASMLVDLRHTDASIRPEVAFRALDGSLLVGTARFEAMLETTRNAVRDFITFLATKFVTPFTPYLAGEVAGVETLSAIGGLCDNALGILRARALGTEGAFAVMEQLVTAESRFVSVWKAGVLPILKSGQKVYDNAFGASVAAIAGYLTGPAPGGFTAIATALADRNLDAAVTTQEQLAAEFGGQVTKPVGVLALKYLGSTSPTVVRNQSLDLRYEVSGSVTPDDDLVVQPFANPAWATILKNSDGSTPFVLHAGPGTVKQQFLITVTPPDVPAATTPISVEVHAKKNAGGLAFLSAQKTLTITAAPPVSEDQFAINIQTTNVPASQGDLQVKVNTVADVTLRVQNNTSTAATVNLQPSTSAVWQITKGPFGLTNQPIAALGSQDFLWHFKAPGNIGDHLVFTLKVVEAANPLNVLAETQVSLVSTP
jgi:hypothetical protein